MKKTLDKVLDGAKYLGKATAIAGTALSSYFSNAQVYENGVRTDVLGHDIGAESRVYKPLPSESRKAEVKILGRDTVYIQHIEPTTYENDADIIAVDIGAKQVAGVRSESWNYVSTNHTYFHPRATDSEGNPITEVTFCDPCGKKYALKFEKVEGSSDKVQMINGDNIIPEYEIINSPSGRTFIVLPKPDYMKSSINLHDLSKNSGNSDSTKSEPARYLDYLVGELENVAKDAKIGEQYFLVDPRTGERTFRGDLFNPTLEQMDSLGNFIDMGEQLIPMYQGPTKKRNGLTLNLEGIAGVNYGPKGLVEAVGAIKSGRVAIGVNAGKNFETTTEITQTEPSELTGNYGYGEVTRENQSSLGAFLKFYFLNQDKVHPFIMGGINQTTDVLNVQEGLKDSNGNWILGSPQTNSILEKTNSQRIGAGIAFKDFEVGIIYDTQGKVAGSFNYRFGGKKE